MGAKELLARIREHVRLARLFADWIEKDKRFELAAPVSMGVVCFRLVAADESSRRSVPPVRLGPKADANAKIVDRINASGSAYITQTKLRGRTVMRIGLGNVLTTEHHLRNVWEMIQTVAKDVCD